MRAGLQKRNIPFLSHQSHIVSIPVGDAQACNAISDHLLEKHGCYVTPINYPTVPRGGERLRITVGPRHTKQMVEHLLAALAACRTLWP